MKNLGIKLENINFEKSVSNLSGLPDALDYEIILVGKSNVGKSSFINSLFNRKKLAKTSNKPGKTRLLNFYNLDSKIYLVDLPGYGYSKMSKEEEIEISNRIEHYLINRKEISLIIQILDIRHMPTDKDLHMFSYILKTGLPFIIILNKADKLKKSEIEKQKEKIKEALNISYSPVLIYSSTEKGEKKEKMNEAIYNQIEKSLTGEI